MEKLTVTDIFTRFFLKQLTYHIARNEGILNQLVQEEVETPPAWKELDAEYDKIMDGLKKDGGYFHQDKGSVFMDFKNLRDSIVPGAGMDNIARNFSSQMGKDELLKKAHGTIEEWQAHSGQEKK